MKQDTHEFRIAPEQLGYLKRTFSRDKSLATLLIASTDAAGKESILRLNRFDAERLRGKLTEQLAKAGFDEDYALTSQGELLEELIDRFRFPLPD